MSRDSIHIAVMLVKNKFGQMDVDAAIVVTRRLDNESVEERWR